MNIRPHRPCWKRTSGTVPPQGPPGGPQSDPRHSTHSTSSCNTITFISRTTKLSLVLSLSLSPSISLSLCSLFLFLPQSLSLCSLSLSLSLPPSLPLSLPCSLLRNNAQILFFIDTHLVLSPCMASPILLLYAVLPTHTVQTLLNK